VLYSYQASVSAPFGFTVPLSRAVVLVIADAPPVFTNGATAEPVPLSIKLMVGTIPRFRPKDWVLVLMTAGRQIGASVGANVRLFVSAVEPLKPLMQVGAFVVPSYILVWTTMVDPLLKRAAWEAGSPGMGEPLNTLNSAVFQ
jgi:hypothetical protein